jgi:hypothetical protein
LMSFCYLGNKKLMRFCYDDGGHPFLLLSSDVYSWNL